MYCLCATLVTTQIYILPVLFLKASLCILLIIGLRVYLNIFRNINWTLQVFEKFCIAALVMY
jgi:hypothetical protein